METMWVADRITLRTLLREHADWRLCDLAEALNRSVGWVKKWKKRLRHTAADDFEVVKSLSRAPHHPPARVPAVMIERILALRDQSPAKLGRIPGPTTILYYLHQDEELKQYGSVPRSTRTIWRILSRHQRIASSRRSPHLPTALPPPLTSWQLDFKDVTTVTVQPDGKLQHLVEVLNTIDVGTSILIDTQARSDFTAETALGAVAAIVEQHGLPEHISLDRDPRWVGSQLQRDFPAPLVRFLLCLGVEVTICPPQRPDRNGFVERYHRTLNEECIQVERPADLDEVKTVIARFQQHYNEERPHQGQSCGNQPPRVAFADLPRRPPVPELVEPDRWLETVDSQCYPRRVGRDGRVKLDSKLYYVSRRLAGQVVTLRIDAQARVFVVEHDGKELKRLTIRGLGTGPLSYAAYVELMQKEARSDARKRQHLHKRRTLPLP